MNLINKKYKILEHLGEGSFGTIYKGVNLRTNQNVAIKVEPIANSLHLLKHESKIYRILSGKKGIPNVRWYGCDEKNNYMVIDLLGKSLQQLRLDHAPFSLRLTLQFGIELVNLIKTVHDMGLVHRDIKLDNFLMDLNDKQLYLIDFGFCKSYKQEDGTHILPKKTSGLIGSNNYASINAHKNIELSRRDDLESVAYLLLCLHFGSLDWDRGQNLTNEQILSYKISAVENYNNPEVLRLYLKYVRLIRFDETPSYYFLTDLFKREIMKMEQKGIYT